MREQLQHATKLHRLGFSVIPLRGKVPAVRWKEYQTKRATLFELSDWFSGSWYEPAIVCGKISGITVYDADDAAAAKCCRTNLQHILAQRTKRGRHFILKHNGERNQRKVCGLNLDVRGEGGYIRAYEDSISWPLTSFMGQVPSLPPKPIERHTEPVRVGVRISLDSFAQMNRAHMPEP